MRIRIVFRLKNRGGFVPFHHQYLLSQLVKGVIISGDQKQFHNFNYYNFSGLKGQTKISRKGLHFFSQYITLVFSTPDEDFLDYFLNRIFSIGSLSVGSLLLEADHVEKEEVIEFHDHAKFICISPVITLKSEFNDEESKRFISPESEVFSDLLYESTMERMIKTGGYTEEKIADFYRFQIVPDAAYLKRLNQKNKKFARIYPVYENDVKYEIRGYTFPFTLYAEKEVLEFVFNCGLGWFTHKGFGMLDMANADYHKRVEKYELQKAAQPTG